MPEGSHAYINAENDGTVVLVDAKKYQMIKAIPLGKPASSSPWLCCSRPMAARLYVSTGRGTRYSRSIQLPTLCWGRSKSDRRPWGIALSLDGKTLYSANGPSNDISVVDLATNTVTKKVKAGTGPWGVIVLPR